MGRWHAHLVERSVPCAWLSLDEGDNDKVRFMRHLLAALQKADSHLGRGLTGSLATDLPSGAKPLLQTLADDLARLQHRIVLFLDDLHFVQEPEVLEIVDWLVNYAPRTVQQLIGSRETRHLRLGGLRVRRQLFELESRKLQFNLEEASRFYCSRLGRELPAADLTRLVDRTEGWPAALELARLALAGLPEQAAFIADFAGTDAGVVDYLGEAVLSRMDERTRTFVCRISMFDRISAPLARAVAHADDAEQPASAALGEPLTRREISILKRLESDLSNKEIAEAIFISEGTLKRHLHNIYSKLDVRNRSGALTRGRALSLL